MLSETPSPRIGYVLKMYPRFSETFVVTEIIAREAAGDDIVVFSLRPPVDPRFHSELARVAAPVHYIDRPAKTSALWDALRIACTSAPLAAAVGRMLPELLEADADDAVQAVLLAAEVERQRITHLHAHFASVSTTVARLASLLTGVGFSFTAHAKDLFHESAEPTDLARKFTDATFAVTVSDYNRTHLHTTFPEQTTRLHLLYNGLELDRFPFEPPRPRRTGSLRIAAVGRLVEKKGFAHLIDAVAAQRAEGIDADCDSVGGGELAAALAARADDSGAGAHIRMRGPMPQDRIAALLRDADVFAAPCVIAQDGNADGLPTVLLEAMATGVPCVSTSVTGIPEIIRPGDTGLLCRPGDTDDLVAALRTVADPAFDAEPMVRRARALIEQRFDSASQAAALSELTRAAPVPAESSLAHALLPDVRSHDRPPRRLERTAVA